MCLERSVLCKTAGLHLAEKVKVDVFSVWKMPHGEPPASKCHGRFQVMYVRACALTLLVCCVLYAATFTDMHVKTAASVKSWNISHILKTAAYKFQNAVQLRPSYLTTKRKRKLVLLWTNYFSDTGDWLPSTAKLECPVTECDVTSDRSYLRNSSAVVLHWRNIDANDLPECQSSEAAHCPLWVLFNKEAPPHTTRDVLNTLQGKVHWVATYRQDSDLFAPYGKITPKEMRSSKTVFDNNRRLICWLVSNCDTPSKRELFVGELTKHIEVDIYGYCGDLKCPYKLVRDCYRWMSNRCMFYLSLENSNCRDYVTEKLFNALASDMVPVVMGNSSYYDDILPPRSFVRVSDFSSPKELAEYLVTVSKDQKQYQSFFQWKRDYEVKDASYKWFCELCRKLHETGAEDVKPRTDLVSWWFDQAKCWSWRNL